MQLFFFQCVAFDPQPITNTNDQDRQIAVSPTPSNTQLEKLAEMPFQCPFPGCSYRVKHKKNLHRHRRQKHGKISSNGIQIIKKHVCNICQSKFLNYDNFRRHHQAKHPKLKENFTEKPFEIVKAIDDIDNE